MTGTFALLAICSLVMVFKIEQEAGWTAYIYGYNSWEVWGLRLLSLGLLIIGIVCVYYTGASWLDGQLMR